MYLANEKSEKKKRGLSIYDFVSNEESSVTDNEISSSYTPNTPEDNPILDAPNMFVVKSLDEKDVISLLKKEFNIQYENYSKNRGLGTNSTSSTYRQQLINQITDSKCKVDMWQINNKDFFREEEIKYNNMLERISKEELHIATNLNTERKRIAYFDVEEQVDASTSGTVQGSKSPGCGCPPSSHKATTDSDSDLSLSV